MDYQHTKSHQPWLGGCFTRKKLLLLLLLPLIGILLGCASTVKKQTLHSSCRTDSDCQVYIEDPWEDVNRRTFAFNQTADDYVLRPLAVAYQTVTPNLVDQGVTNFFTNLDRIPTLWNSALQGKPNSFYMTLNALLLDSVFGLGGLILWSEVFGVRQYEEDFNQTLALWGVESGPYLVVPFLGPSTVRDVSSFVVERELSFSYGLPNEVTSISASVLNLVDFRSSLLGLDKKVKSITLDEYAFFRESYYQRMRNEIYDDSPPPVFEDSSVGDDSLDLEDLEELDDLDDLDSLLD